MKFSKKQKKLLKRLGVYQKVKKVIKKAERPCWKSCPKATWEEHSWLDQEPYRSNFLNDNTEVGNDGY